MSEVRFLVAFIFTLSLIAFLIGDSINAKVIQTGYCDNTGCYEYCKTSSDCAFQKCCLVKNFGVCKSDCFIEFNQPIKNEFDYNIYPEFEGRAEKSSYIERPLTIAPKIYLLAFLLLITWAVGHFYVLVHSQNNVR